jgi:UDP-N-acetylglucosamine 4,6-dehydratase/UDP-glucose 4-epimerase
MNDLKIKKDKIYLITGGSGFLGVPLCEKILSLGGKVRAIARDEGKLIELKEQFKEVEILTGDIYDKFEVKQAMKGVTGVFHLAASKHVGIAEKQVRECVKSNTFGSLNILEESLVTKPEFVLGVSTDKAAKVAGVYGASKLLMERLFGQFEALNPDTEYRLVRYGNVLYSTGSVLCKWKDLLEQGKEVIVTDGNATRFFWTVDQAVDLIFDCLANATNYEPHITDMKSMSINNLLKAMSQKYLPEGKELKIKYIGLQPGENMHEIITEDGFSSEKAERFTIDEILELI